MSKLCPSTPQQSKQWVKKGRLGPIKSRVLAYRTNLVVLVLFTAAGAIYTNYVLRGDTVNTTEIQKALAGFLKIFHKKRPIMASQNTTDAQRQCPLSQRCLCSGLSLGKGPRGDRPATLFIGPGPDERFSI
jgi:Transposase (partial DDE domain)